jgi:hypothetical protein
MTLVIVVDMEGRPAGSAGVGKAAVLGLKDRDLTPVRDAPYAYPPHFVAD